ncbi:BolA family transcriptional regulator [Ectothiorhodospiraceae bacterium 2226]|nr:BolA family transcriptional regulator [Ectothiorhodospiraceae bacterium 2226]
MQPNEIKQLIEQGLDGAQAYVSGDGSHFDAVVVGEMFRDKSLLQKQRLVNATVNDRITSGELHALSIKCYTPEEWAQAGKPGA